LLLLVVVVVELLWAEVAVPVDLELERLWL
jgi:hypothetical protein